MSSRRVPLHTDFQTPAWNNIEDSVLSELVLDKDDMLDFRELAHEFSSLA